MKRTLCSILVGLALGSGSIAQEIYPYGPISSLVGYKKPDTKMLSRAKLYERASETRRKAAEIQKGQAEKNHSLAWDLNQRFQEKEEFYLKDKIAAGELDLQAGDLLISASKNYILSHSNLVSAVKIYQTIEEKVSEKLEKRMEEDAEEAESCYSDAIEYFISAAESFEKGRSAEKEAVANMRAASHLENSASEK